MTDILGNNLRSLRFELNRSGHRDAATVVFEACAEIERLRNIIHHLTAPTVEDLTHEDYEAIYGWGGQDRLY